MIRTRFTEMFGLDFPIMSAPMGLAHSDGHLAAAVSEAGALGTFGAMNATRDAAWARDQIALIRERTSRPFGVGFITHFLADWREVFDAVIEQNPPIVVLSFADPEPWLSRAKNVGAKVVCQVQTFELAQAAVGAGADAIAAQGNEAGGHTGVMGLLPFLARLRDTFPDTPLLAAGGVGDARTLAGVLAAGADGAWVGTAFLACTEAPVPTSFKEAIVRSDGGDTVFTKVPDIVFGSEWPEPIAVRLGRNKVVQRWIGREDELLPQRATVMNDVFAAMGRGDTDEGMVLYGPAAGVVDTVRSAADIIREMADGAERILRTEVAALFD
jgi:nitronate monooxygenase